MNTRAIRIKRRFFVDSQDAKNFIAENSPQAADRFLIDLKRKMAEISRNPEAFGLEKYLPTKRNLYRRAIFKKRWRIIFKVLEDKIVFLALFHMKRNPDSIADFRTNDYS